MSVKPRAIVEIFGIFFFIAQSELQISNTYMADYPVKCSVFVFIYFKMYMD